MSDTIEIPTTGQWHVCGPKSYEVFPICDQIRAACEKNYCIVVYMTAFNSGNCQSVTDEFRKYVPSQKYLHYVLHAELEDRLRYVKIKDGVIVKDYGSTPPVNVKPKEYTVINESNQEYLDLRTMLQDAGFVFKSTSRPHIVTIRKGANGLEVTSTDGYTAIHVWADEWIEAKYGIIHQKTTEDYANKRGEAIAAYFEIQFNGAETPIEEIEDIYTVKFYDRSGNVVSTQSIQRNKNAEPPTLPEVPTYVFTGWSPSYVNITADTDCFPQYEKKTYENPRIVSEINEETTKFAYP